jgi:hypothetical protein
MPHATSAISRAITARVHFTGEPRRLARHHIGRLNPAPSMNDVRLKVLLPEASAPAQQDLEARLLMAASGACRSLYGRHPFTYPFRYICPKTDGLDVVPLPQALAEFAFEFLPRQYDDGEIGGVPGLRAFASRRGIILRTLGPSGRLTGAQVLLKGVSRRSWREAVATANAQPLDGPATMSFAHERDLTHAEHQFMRRYQVVNGPIALASAMLRRLHILRSACWIHVWTADRAFKVEWCHGPDLRETSRLLIRPPAGIRDPQTTLQEPDPPGDDHLIYWATLRAAVRAPGPDTPSQPNW